MPGPDSYALSLWHCATVGEIEAWLDSAAPGDRFEYAGGRVFPPVRTAGWVRAREAYQAGLVILHTKRDVVSAQYSFAMVRRAVVAADDGAAELSLPERRMLEVAGARLGLPLPQNQELAELVAVRNADAASYILRKLMGRGLICVERERPRGQWRRVVRAVTA